MFIEESPHQNLILCWLFSSRVLVMGQTVVLSAVSRSVRKSLTMCTPLGKDTGTYSWASATCRNAVLNLSLVLLKLCGPDGSLLRAVWFGRPSRKKIEVHLYIYPCPLLSQRAFLVVSELAPRGVKCSKRHSQNLHIHYSQNVQPKQSFSQNRGDASCTTFRLDYSHALSLSEPERVVRFNLFSLRILGPVFQDIITFSVI